jgi:hypothetical protein
MLATACQRVEQPPFVFAARRRLADFDAHLADAPRAANLRAGREEESKRTRRAVFASRLRFLVGKGRLHRRAAEVLDLPAAIDLPAGRGDGAPIDRTDAGPYRPIAGPRFRERRPHPRPRSDPPAGSGAPSGPRPAVGSPRPAPAPPVRDGGSTSDVSGWGGTSGHRLKVHPRFRLPTPVIPPNACASCHGIPHRSGEPQIRDNAFALCRGISDRSGKVRGRRRRPRRLVQCRGR